jgi:hypothetical protein
MPSYWQSDDRFFPQLEAVCDPDGCAPTCLLCERCVHRARICRDCDACEYCELGVACDHHWTAYR